MLPIIDPQISYGALITLVVTLCGFGATLLYQAYRLGSYAAANEQHLARLTEKIGDLSERMRGLERNEEKMTTILIDIAQSKVELQLMSKRIDDVQMHGSHRLAEILAGLRSERHPTTQRQQQERPLPND